MMNFILAAFLVAVSAIASPSKAVHPRHFIHCYDGTKKEHWWTISNFDYRLSDTFSSPDAHTAFGSINFTLTHPGIDYEAQCSAQFSEESAVAGSSDTTDFIDGNIRHACNVPGGIHGDTVKFSYSSSNSMLRIDHFWNCGGTRTWYEAVGLVKLSCEKSYEHDPEWTPASNKSYSSHHITCAHAKTTAPVVRVVTDTG
ncbi:hypothetical protein DCS_00599 [Drechmeria coniospora]|uniref:AA1-like domain-containing protein n=1 Tax=Drechmeria coniospora TaxID=98403 RepID=A0A151GQT8_DRECN|nr:hypothetical protein DCS_00599 [Drechmeria coniospora]KYK59469.1 hypothetical protein DCS_00599 [Drechmeria coniospora]ODA76288.1 hypothetical protein RJ55_08133 [Drechmeria coniospora]